MKLRPGNVACLGEIDDGRLGLVEADADDLEAGIMIGAVGRLQPGKLGDAGSAPGRPEIDQDVLAAVGVEPDGLALDVLAREGGAGLPTLSSRFRSLCTFCRRLGLSLKPREERGINLARGPELARGDGRRWRDCRQNWRRTLPARSGRALA